MTKEKNITQRCAERIHELSDGLLSTPEWLNHKRLLMPCVSGHAFALNTKDRDTRFYLIRKRSTHLELWVGQYNLGQRISRTTRGVDAPQHLEYDAKTFLDDIKAYLEDKTND